MEEYLLCQEVDLFTITSKGALDVNQDYGWGLEGSCLGKISDRLPKGIVTNRSVHIRYLDVFRCVALGEYFHIWEV